MKADIEKQVEEILQVGIIRPNNNPLAL